MILGTFRAFNADIELLGKQVNNALNVHLNTKGRQNHKNFVRPFARLPQIFLRRKKSTHLFTKMSLSEELGTLEFLFYAEDDMLWSGPCPRVDLAIANMNFNFLTQWFLTVVAGMAGPP